MKKLVARILIVGTALAGAAAVYAQARVITANVPFNFYMGSKAMPQGAYRVDEISRGEVVALRTDHAANSLTTYGVAEKSENESARLVFRRYGSTYFLAQIWTGDSSNGRAFAKSLREKELAQSGPAPTLAVIRLALQ